MAADSVGDFILAQFQAFDQNEDGTIDKTELISVLRSMGVDADRWTEERVEKVLDAADANRDGVIQYEEFLAFVTKEGEDQADFKKAATRVAPEAVVELVRALSNQASDAGRTDIVTALQQLSDAPWEKKEAAMQLLMRLLQNIVREPGNPKFRRMKKTNKTLAQKVFSVHGTEELLMAAGFELEGEELVLPEGKDVSWLVDKLNAFGQDEMNAKLRAERDARIAAVRAEEEKGKQFKSAGLPSGGSGDEEKRAILQKAEYDRQERVAKAKLAAEGFREENHVAAEKNGVAVTRFADIGVDTNATGG